MEVIESHLRLPHSYRDDHAVTNSSTVADTFLVLALRGLRASKISSRSSKVLDFVST